ncbi:MAG: hypothetical protein PVI43_00880 [Candidatus Bathyarchaeota archaeon]|jgi:hypothetical protein
MSIYQNNIPQAADLLSESQTDLRNNYIAHNEYFDIDHVRYSATENNGKHSKSTYVSQGAPPATGATEIALFSEDNGNGRINLKARYQSNGNEIGISPFAAARFNLVLGGTLLFLGSPININQGASTFAGSAITITFATNAADTNYYVFTNLESTISSSVLALTPTVHTKAAGSFIVEIPQVSTDNTVNIMVYEQ